MRFEDRKIKNAGIVHKDNDAGHPGVYSYCLGCGAEMVEPEKALPAPLHGRRITSINVAAPQWCGDCVVEGRVKN